MKEKITLSHIILIVSNLAVLLSILYYREGLFLLLIIYWIESVLIGLLNIVKLWMIKSWIISRIFASLFFILHFGVAMAVYIVFIFVIGDVLEAEITEELRQNPVDFLLCRQSLLIALSAITISHTFSLIKNYILKKEYAGIGLTAQMFKPYNRVLVMHGTVMAGVFLLAFLKFSTTVGIMCAIGLMKSLLDVWAHHNARKAAKKLLFTVKTYNRC